MIRGLTGPLAAAVEGRLQLTSSASSSRRWRPRQEARVEADIAARRESVYPYLRCAAVAARRGADGPLHPRLADGQPAQALFRYHHAIARPGRDGTGCLDHSRPATHDPRVPDDRGAACPSLPTPHRRPSVTDAAPRRSGAASRASAEISREGDPSTLAHGRPSALSAPSS
jgi:hypothetical protein